VRTGKYTAASQAYELLRIRNKMQDELLKQSDAAIENGDIEAGVRGYRIATGLSYDYAAFPEPLPAVPNYQQKALILHGIYPTRPEDCVALQPEETHVNTSLQFLLRDEQIAVRLQAFPHAIRLQFLKHLVHQIDPEWNEFAQRFTQACVMTQAQGDRLKRIERPHAETLQDEIEDQRGGDPIEIMATLLGHVIEGGEWWQYLKEIALRHPPAVLCIARQLIGETEILMPRMLAGSALPTTLGLMSPAET